MQRDVLTTKVEVGHLLLIWNALVRYADGDDVVLQHAVRSRLIQLRPPNGELQGLRMVAEDVEEERMLEYEEEENEIDKGGGKEKVEPMTCVMDFECTQNVNKEFEVVRVGWKYLGEIGSYWEAGTAMDFLHDAQARTVTEDVRKDVRIKT